MSVVLPVPEVKALLHLAVVRLGNVSIEKHLLYLLTFIFCLVRAFSSQSFGLEFISESLTSKEYLFCILRAVGILNESRKIQSLPLRCCFHLGVCCIGDLRGVLKIYFPNHTSVKLISN